MLNTPANWNAAMANGVPWQDAYAAVEEAVKTLFLDPAVTGRVTTSRLVEFLYPEQWAKGEGLTARKRIFGALKALAKHQLKGYCEPGEPRPLKHNKTKLVTPLIWRAPPAEVEPTLAEVIFACVNPGIRWMEEDRPAYEAAAEAARKSLNG